MYTSEINNVLDCTLTGSNVNIGGLQTREMAGYINALYGLCAETAGNPLSGVLHNDTTSDPRLNEALRVFMGLIGNPDFAQALTDEYNAQMALPLNERCVNFMGSDGLGDKDGLYYSLTQSTTFQDSSTPPNVFTGSVLQLAQNFVQNYPSSWTGWTTCFNQMLNALPLGTSLYQVIANIGQPPASGGWSAAKITPYQESQDPNLQMAITYFNQFVSDIQKGDTVDALTQLRNFVNAGKAPSSSGDPACPTLADDPNYQALYGFLNDEWFNISPQPDVKSGWPVGGGAIMNSDGTDCLKDSSGNTIYAYTIMQFLDAYSSVQPQDQSAYYAYFQKIMNAMMGTPGNSGQSWVNFFADNLLPYYSEW